MSESGISERQNEPKSLDYLAAQRQLYNEEKQFTSAWLVVSTLIAILGTGVFASLSGQTPLLNFLSLVVVLGQLFLLPLIQRKRTVAAGIQELFDSHVLDLDWNAALAQKPESEDIVAALARFNRQKEHAAARNRLLNWYEDPIIHTAPLAKARIACQKESVRWDEKQREVWSNWLTWGVVGLAVVLILVGILVKLPIGNLFAGPILLMVPIVTAVLKSASAHRKAIPRLAELRHNLDLAWNDAEHTDTDDSKLEQRSREIQNEIYRHRRDDPPVPNFVYEWYKKRLQAASAAAVDDAR